MDTNIKISGLKEARAALKLLPDRVQKRVQGAATRSGATVMRAEARRDAPVGDEPSEASKKYGSLKSNIRIIKLKRVPKGTTGYRVNTGDAFWGVILEVGSRFMAARPWFRPAIDRSRDKALDKMRERLAAGIEREAKKLSK